MNQTSILAEHDTRSRVQVVMQASSSAVFIFSSIFGNTLIFVAIYTNHQLRQITSVFIVSLACADFFLSTTVTPFILVTSVTFEWIFGPELCKFTGTLNVLFCNASILSLAAVAIERYVAIIKPLKYYTIMTRRNVIIMIIYVWSHAFICAVLPITGWAPIKYLQMESMCVPHWSNSVSYVIFLFTLSFFIPLLVMTYCYYHILKAAKDHSKRIQPTTIGVISQELQVPVLAPPTMSNISEIDVRIGSAAEKAKRRKAAAEKKYKKDAKAAKTLLVVMGTFVFCWSPYLIGMMCLLFPSCNWPDEYFAASTWLAMMNSGCNPIIYGALNRRFRQSYKKILCRCYRLSGQTDSNIVSTYD